MTNYAHAQDVDFADIPVIDVSGWSDPDHQSDIAMNLMAAAQSSGFFYVSGHGIDPDLRKAAFEASARFFALPEEQKATVKVDQNQRGWMGVGASNLEGAKTYDAKEVFFWGWEVAPNDPDLHRPLVACNQWPDQSAPWLRTELTPYYEAVIALGHDLMAALAMGLGVDPGVFAQAYEKPLARGQLVYYPPVTQDDQASERFSAAAHTDFGVLTILAQDDNGGLQVRNRAGDWIAAPPIPDTFVCNIGDLLQHWTGGRLVSTLHRVLNTSGRARFSIPIFHDPASAALIDPSDLFEGDTGANAITAGEYIVSKNRKNFAHFDKG